MTIVFSFSLSGNKFQGRYRFGFRFGKLWKTLFYYFRLALRIMGTPRYITDVDEDLEYGG